MDLLRIRPHISHIPMKPSLHDIEERSRQPNFRSATSPDTPVNRMTFYPHNTELHRTPHYTIYTRYSPSLSKEGDFPHEHSLIVTYSYTLLSRIDFSRDISSHTLFHTTHRLAFPKRSFHRGLAHGVFSLPSRYRNHFYCKSVRRVRHHLHLNLRSYELWNRC